MHACMRAGRKFMTRKHECQPTNQASQPGSHAARAIVDKLSRPRFFFCSYLLVDRSAIHTTDRSTVSAAAYPR